MKQFFLTLAGVFAGLGSRTTLLHRGAKLLRGFDEDVRDCSVARWILLDWDKAIGSNIRLGRTATRV